MAKVVKFPTKKCAGCGRPVLISAPVCTHCGARLDDPLPTSPVSVPPPMTAVSRLNPTYLLIGADGVEYGPVDLPGLMLWIREGRVQPDNRLKEVNTGRLLSARELPAFRAMYSSYGTSQSLIDRSTAQYQAATPGAIQVAPGSHMIWLAILLAVLLAGAGQIYNRQILKGLVLLFGTYLIGFVALGMYGIALWALGIADAAIVASRLDRGEPVSPWKFF